MSSPDLSMAMPMRIAAPKGRVLCVDDEPSILRALRWLLQKEFEVVTATSGREGLELVRLGDFDVVISDLRMPEMNGMDFLREVRAIAPRAMRILLTDYSDGHSLLHSVNESEIFRYVTKPWDTAELPKIIAQAAEIARSQQAAQSLPADGSDVLPEAGKAKILVLDNDIGIHAAVEICAGDMARVIHATNVADAIHLLHNIDAGVLVAETRIGSLDLTHLICLLKQRHPQVASVILAEDTGADTVTTLVNQGQVFRVVAKPLHAVQLRKALRSALCKSQQLLQQPEPALETGLKVPTTGLTSAGPASAVRHVAAASFANRMGDFFRRLFVGADSHA